METPKNEDVKVIVICGKKRAGKSTVAAYLKEFHDFIEETLAGPLKKSLKAIYGFSEEQVNGDLKEIIDPYWGVTPRALLQFVGTECIRELVGNAFPSIGPDVWVKSLKRRIDNLIDLGFTKIVVSDVRYPNELEALVRDYKAKVFLVKRDIDTDKDPHAAHKSECSLDGIVPDVVLDNNGSLEYLDMQIEKAIARIK